MGLNTAHLVIGIVVCCNSLPLAGSCTDNIKCTFDEKKTFTCGYNVTDNTDGNYTCRMAPIDSDLNCSAVETGWTKTKETGKCQYACQGEGNCRSGRVAAHFTCQHHNTCRVFTLDEYIKPGPVLYLKVVNITKKSLRVRWEKPNDYDNRNDSYNYTILLKTDSETKKGTREKKHRNNRFKFRKLKPWTTGTITITAKSTRGGFPGEPVSRTIRNPFPPEPTRPEENDRTGLIVGIVIAVLLLTSGAVAAFVYICKKEWWPTFQIILPKDDNPAPPPIRLCNADKEQLNRTTRPPPIPQDSGRGSMETNNNDTYSHEGDGIHRDKDPLLDIRSENNDTGPPANHVEAFEDDDWDVSVEDDDWDVSVGSCLSNYRQVPSKIDVKTSFSDGKSLHKNPAYEGDIVSKSFSHIPQSCSPADASQYSGSVPNSVASYSAVSLQMKPPLDGASLCSKQVKLKAVSTAIPGTVDDMCDRESIWDDSGGSCLSNYRQVPADDNSMEDSQKEKSDINSKIIMYENSGDSCIDIFPHTLSSSSSIPLLHSPTSDCKHLPQGTSNNDLTLSTDIKVYVHETNDEWDDVEGSGLSSYRQVPAADDNTEDTRGDRADMTAGNGDDSVSILSSQSRNTSLSSLSLSISAPESVTSYSAVSIPNTDNLTESSQVSPSLSGSWSNT